MKKILAERASVQHLGKEMMARWNTVELEEPLFRELAVMGHLDGNVYTFIIEVNGLFFECAIKQRTRQTGAGRPTGLIEGSGRRGNPKALRAWYP
jgi:hypothetical protein